MKYYKIRYRGNYKHIRPKKWKKDYIRNFSDFLEIINDRSSDLIDRRASIEDLVTFGSTVFGDLKIELLDLDIIPILRKELDYIDNLIVKLLLEEEEDEYYD